MADSKPRHYVVQLDRALTAGAWADASPATNPGGTAIPWAELVRKWEKHVGGTAGSLALCLRTLSLYLRPTSSSPAGGRTGSSTSAPPLPTVDTPTSATSQGTAGASSTHRSHRPHLHTQHPIPASFVPATNISARDLDGDDRSGRPTSLAPGDPWSKCQAPDDRISDVEEGLREVVELVAKSKNAGEKDSALLLQALHLLALARYQEALTVSSQVDWNPAATNTSSKVPSGSASEAAIVERVRGRFVEGLCHELLTPPSPSAALASYTSAVHLLESLPTLSLPFPSSEKPSTTQSTTNILKEFTSHRELWRWAENAMFRGSLLAASSGSSGEGLKWLRTYHFYETVLPPSFRPERRAAILLLYVRALALERPSPAADSTPPATIVSPPAATGGLVSRSRGSAVSTTAAGWAKEVENVMRRGMTILEAGGTRAFPKAGEKRHEVEEFVVGCVGLWERGGGKRGAEASALLKLLWWVTTQTFNSQPVLRHLTRLLLASGSATDARRTFELYVKIVDKARETADSPATPTPANAHSSGEAVEPREAEPLESDDDRTFVETLIFGGRLIGRDLNDPREGLKFLRRALDLMDAEGTDPVKHDDELRARIEGAKGLLKMALVIKDHDPLARSNLQSEALKHLTSATVLSPNSGKAFYNLAYAQAECREIDASTLSIKSALELEPGNVHGWHLLTLLLTAKGKWHDAAKIADIGLASWDGDEDELDDSTVVNGAGEADGTVTQKDFVVVESPTPPASTAAPSSADTTSPPTTTSNPPLIGHNSRLIPMSSLLSSNPTLSSTKGERLEAVLQLRMTQTMIVERLDGPEAAMERQQELFAFFSARCGKVLTPPAPRGVPVSRADTIDTNGSSVRDTRRVDFGTVEKRSYDEPRSVSGEGEGATGTNGTGRSESGASGNVVDISVTSPPPPPEVHVEAPNGSSPALSGANTPGSSSASSLENGSVRDQNRKQRFLPKHLLTPGSGRHHGLGRSASLSRLQIARQSASSLALTSLGQNNHSRRSISNASSIHNRSRRQSPAGSTHGSFDLPPAAPTPPSPDQEPSGRTPRETRLLSSLWLMSAATFRRQAKMEQALGAIQEAEVLDATNPEVWVQLGLYHDLLSSPTLAISSLTKALVFDPLYIPAHVHLARLYLLTSSTQPSNLALAHGILNSLTQGVGWDCAEAWYFLARCCELQGGREERVRECLEFGKRLGEGRCVRALGGGVLERWI